MNVGNFVPGTDGQIGHDRLISSAGSQQGLPHTKHTSAPKVACEQPSLFQKQLQSSPEYIQFCSVAPDSRAPAAPAGHQLPKPHLPTRSLNHSDSLQEADQVSRQGTPSPICDSNNAGSSRRQLQMSVADIPATQAAVVKPARPAEGAKSTGIQSSYHHHQHQRQHGVPAGSSDGSYSPHKATSNTTRPVPQDRLFNSHKELHQHQQHQPAVISGSSSAAGCSSATATAPQGSGHSGLGSSTPPAAAAAAAAAESESVMRSQDYHPQSSLQHQNPQTGSGFSSRSDNQGFAASNHHTLAVQSQMMPGQSADQGLAMSSWNEGSAVPGLQRAGLHDMSNAQSREPLFRSSSTNPAVGAQFRGPSAAVTTGVDQHIYHQPIWQSEQQRQLSDRSYGAAAAPTPAAVRGVQDLSMQYHSLAAQQEMLRKQISDLQQQEKLLLQRQASAAAVQAAPHPPAAAAPAAANLQGVDPFMLAAWHSFTAEGVEADQVPPVLPHLRIKSSPPATAAGASAAAAASLDVWQQSDLKRQQHIKQQQQQQQQDNDDNDDSPVCGMDSSGGSDSSGHSNKQQVAAVLADIVDNIVAHTQQPAAADEQDEQDELTSSGENGHDEGDMAAATAAAMSWMLEDQPHAATAAAAATARLAAVLAPMDSCSPMLPSSRRKQQQQQQGAMPGSTEPLAVPAAADGEAPYTSVAHCAPVASSDAAGAAVMPGPQVPPGGSQGLRVTPPPAVVQSGRPMSDDGMCMLDELDFDDDFVPSGMLLDDLLDFGSPPRDHGPVGASTADAAGHGSMQQQHFDPAFGGISNGSRRNSWGIPSPMPSPHFSQQQQQQQMMECNPCPSNSCPTPPPAAAAAAASGSSGLPARRISHPMLPPVGVSPALLQPHHRQVAGAGLHSAVPWHGQPPGRPTVTTGSNQGLHHGMGPHVVSTFQQQQQYHALGPHALQADTAPQQVHSMTPSTPGGLMGAGAEAVHSSYQSSEFRVASMASCPPDMLSNMSRGPAAAALSYSREMQQQQHYQQQQQSTIMSPRTQSWSGAQHAVTRQLDECIDAQLQSMTAGLHHNTQNTSAAGSWQRSLQQYTSQNPNAAAGSHAYHSSSLQQHSRPVTTGESPEQHAQYDQHLHQQRQQQQQQQQQLSLHPGPRLHQHGDSPFSNAQAQNVHFHSLGLAGPLPGLGLPNSSLEMPGAAHDSLRVSGSGHSGLRAPGPPGGPQQLSQHHSLYSTPDANRPFMHYQPQQYQQPADTFTSLHRSGSAPVMPSHLHLQPSGPNSYTFAPRFAPTAGPHSALRSAPSAPHDVPGPVSQGLYSQGSGVAQLPGLGFNGPTTAAQQQQQQQQQQQMKINLKVQVQPVKRGRGRPPSRARLAAKEVDIIPVPVRNYGIAGGVAAADTAAAASGIKYLDAPSSITMPVQQYRMYSTAVTSTAAIMPAGYVGMGLPAAVAAAKEGFGNSEGLMSASQLQRKRSGQITGLESHKSSKSVKLEGSSSGSERANSYNSNSSGNSGSIIIPKKKTGMPMPFMRNGVLIPPPAGPEMTARGKPTFADLVQASAFPPGTYEFSVGTVQSVTASISSGGIITYENEQYQSISSFALAAARSRNPNRQACDGWKEVRLQGMKLELWRQAFLNKLPPPAIPPGCIKMEGPKV